MDYWDPAVVNSLANDWPVVVFGNTGVGKSSGTTPDSIAQMAADGESFILTRGFTTVDLLGFSIGGMVAQGLAAEHPKLVRKPLLVGTAPQGANRI
jgi:pimeloyl-ACP methyl ester carboxylesterase